MHFSPVLINENLLSSLGPVNAAAAAATYTRLEIDNQGFDPPRQCNIQGGKSVHTTAMILVHRNVIKCGDKNS